MTGRGKALLFSNSCIPFNFKTGHFSVLFVCHCGRSVFKDVEPAPLSSSAHNLPCDH